MRTELLRGGHRSSAMMTRGMGPARVAQFVQLSAVVPITRMVSRFKDCVCVCVRVCVYLRTTGRRRVQAHVLGDYRFDPVPDSVSTACVGNSASASADSHLAQRALASRKSESARACACVCPPHWYRTHSSPLSLRPTSWRCASSASGLCCAARRGSRPGFMAGTTHRRARMRLPCAHGGHQLR